MSGESFIPQAVTMFGGWVPNAAPAGLTAGMGWGGPDGGLVAGGGRTPRGLGLQFPPPAGGPSGNSPESLTARGGRKRVGAPELRGDP